MRVKGILVLLILALMLAVPHFALAVNPVHNFDCKKCHLSGLTINQIGGANVCLTCHGATPATTTTNLRGDATSGAGFVTGDASNHFGNNGDVAAATSHNWAATSVNPAAGAKEPVRSLHPGFFSRYGTTVGKVACSRCHQPHGDMDINPKLLTTTAYGFTAPPMAPNDMCEACHQDYVVADTEHGLLGHPVGMNYYNSAALLTTDPVNIYNSAITLKDGKYIDCTTCHGTHATDSNAMTVDGKYNAAYLGDGLLLKHNGPAREKATGYGICQSCHIYEGHALGGSNAMGCLVCHGGHAYDETAPNYFMLNKQITLAMVPKTGLPGVVTLNFDTDPTTMSNYDNNTGIFGAVCLDCHNMPATHAAGDLCAECHNHNAASGSFGASCGACHGYAPSVGLPGNANPGGYAVSTATGNDYNASGFYKDEASTPHATHANGGAGQYAFTCADCHGSGSGDLSKITNNEHDNNNFRQVLDTSIGALTALTTSKGALTPVYAEAGSGSCTVVYCHSNGRVQGRAESVALTTVTASPWALGINEINDCTVCHDVRVGGTKAHSPAHNIHLSKSFACGVCHSDTAVNATTLAANYKTAHVNGAADLVPSGFANKGGVWVYDDTQGTCATYCHTNGKGVGITTPDWDVATTGDCGDCHGGPVGTESSAGVPSVIASGSHSKHLSASISCDVCHGAGAVSGTHAGHVDGDGPDDYDLIVDCKTCHGATADQTTGADREPIWGNSASVDCATCHTGSAIANMGAGTGSGSYMDVATFYASGHGDSGLNTTTDCTGCHNAAAAGHFNGDSADDRLTGGAASNDAFCKTCHGTKNSHYADSNTAGGGSTDGNACNICHNPHGKGMGTNTDVMLIVGAGFADKELASSYFNASNTGVCQVCHVATDGVGGEIKYYNKTEDPTTRAHNSTTKCATCHSHSATPAFAPGAGTNCGDCHGFPPTDSSHPKHTYIIDGVKANEDLTDCSSCHTGADLYTYDQTGDLTSGVANRQKHGAGQATQVATLLASVGYSSTNKNCTTACHTSTVGNGGVWAAGTQLACNACHLNPPANGGGDSLAHSKHIAAGQTCATCHVSVPTNTTHINGRAGATDLLKLQDAAQALSSEANVVVTTWNSTNNTCANVACHDPSASGKLADWDTSISSCTLCHGDATSMATGSHSEHLTQDTDCSKCHPSAAGNMAHLNGLTVNAALNYNGELVLPSTAYGSCNSTVCHYDPQGEDGVNTAQESAVWGELVASSCMMCHESPSTYGDHQPHFSVNRVANGMTCYSCHSGTVTAGGALIPVASLGKHLDGSKTDVIAGGNFDATAVTITYASAPDPSSCTANCHTTGNPKLWTPATSCESCHGDLSSVGTTHTRHIDITGSISADVSECSICHGDVSGYTLAEGGNHQNSTTNLVAGISNTTCTSACHASAAGDGSWTDNNGLNCSACHAYPMADGAHTAHVTTANITCSACHGTVDAAGTSPLTHNAAKDLNASTTITNAEALQSRGKDYINPTGLDINVNDSAYNAGSGSSWINSSVLDDGGNTCSNVVCHNPSGLASIADWDEDVASCTLCHGNDAASGQQIPTGSHNNHLGADVKFGITITCARCHPDHGANFAHFVNGSGVPNALVQFGGTVITNEYLGEKVIPNSGYGTCSTNDCHNNGQGGAPITAFTWGTGVASDCQFCHDDPPSSGRHQTHLGTTVSYGPHAGVASTNCGECHNANNNLTMTGKTTHINKVIDFNDATSVARSAATTDGIVVDATVAACNNCHGAKVATTNVNAALAKAQWHTAVRLDCESCHGDFGPTNSKADNTGVAAPTRAGTGYDASGHGKTGVAKTCNECHDSTTAHVSGALDDANRLDTMTKGSTYSYEVLAQRNNWCGACHATTMNYHYANTNTPLGTSDDALYCNICHDPHGQNGGQLKMVASNIAGSTVTGFTDLASRSSFANASYTGVCQVCHDGGEVAHFNRTTFGDDGLGAHNAGVCTSCHKVTDNPKFAASGCSGCHGGGVGAGNNYWPDSSNARAENTAGRHNKHMERLALSKYSENITALLTDNGNGSSDAKQKALCAYCHTNPGQDADHSLTLPAEVNSMANLWNGVADNGVWAAGTNSGNCSSTNCHNNQTTPSGYGWYGPNASACTMCHVAGNADNLANNNIHPNSGLHRVVNTSTVQAHNHTMVGPPGSSGCTSCHTSAQPSTHIDGIAVADTNTNTDRFLMDGTAAGDSFEYIEGVPNQASCGSTVGLIAGCHSDLGNWRRLWSTQADSIDTALGSPRCNVCHGQNTGGSSLGWVDGYDPAYQMSLATGANIGHNRININDTSKHNNCEYCHVAPAGPYNQYNFATMHENDMVETNNGAGVGYNSAIGSCTNFCHPSGSTQTMAGSQIWPNNPLLGASPNCGICHDELGGGLLPPYDTSIPGFGGGAHGKHVFGAATVYADTTNKSTAANYNYGCANCHPNDIFWHNNGKIELTLTNTAAGPLKSLNATSADPDYTLFNALNSWTISGGGITASGSTPATRNLNCSAAYCHSDAKGNFRTSPDWYGGAFSGTDPCANCHLNSPDGTSHQPHNVGVHYNNVYTGTTGVIKDTDLNQNAHGDPLTSTTISCQLCHYDTLQANFNANHAVCATCHSDTNTPATGNETADGDPAQFNKSKHLNGIRDVKFQPTTVLSKAQLRDPLADAPEIDDNWKRKNGYKVDSTSHDLTWDKAGGVERPLDTATMYDPATKNCTVACHNNVDIAWGATVISCSNCHTQLPK